MIEAADIVVLSLAPVGGILAERIASGRARLARLKPVIGKELKSIPSKLPAIMQERKLTWRGESIFDNPQVVQAVVEEVVPKIWKDHYRGARTGLTVKGIGTLAALGDGLVSALHGDLFSAYMAGSIAIALASGAIFDYKYARGLKSYVERHSPTSHETSHEPHVI